MQQWCRPILLVVSNFVLLALLLLDAIPSAHPFVALSPPRSRYYRHHHRRTSVVQQQHRKSKEDHHNEGSEYDCESSVRHTVYEIKRWKKTRAAVAVAAVKVGNSMACILGGISLGAQVSLAAMTSTTTTSLFDVGSLPTDRSYSTTTGTLVVSSALDVLSFPKVSDLNFGFGDLSSPSSTPSRSIITEESTSEGNTSDESPPPPSAVEVAVENEVVPETTIIENTPNTEIKTNGGFSIPGLSDVSDIFTDLINPSEEKKKEAQEKRIAAQTAAEEKRKEAQERRMAAAESKSNGFSIGNYVNDLINPSEEKKKEAQEREAANLAALEEQKRQFEERKIAAEAAAKEKQRIAEERKIAVTAAAQKQNDERKAASAAAVEEIKKQAQERRERAAVADAKYKIKLEKETAERIDAFKNGEIYVPSVRELSEGIGPRVR